MRCSKCKLGKGLGPRKACSVVRSYCELGMTIKTYPGGSDWPIESFDIAYGYLVLTSMKEKQRCMMGVSLASH